MSSKAAQWRQDLLTSGEASAEYAASIGNLPADVSGMKGKLKAIDLFPVKSLGALRVERARIGLRGLETDDGEIADRQLWLGYHNPGEACGQKYQYRRLSQREEACLAMARLRRGEWLHYTATNIRGVTFSPEDLKPVEGPAEPVRFFDADPEIVEGVMAPSSDPILQFVRNLVQRHGTGRIKRTDVQLFRPHHSFRRKVGMRHSGGEELETGASDGGYAHVVLAESVSWLNGLISGEPILPEAARANVILEGLPANADDVAYEVEFDCENRPRMVLESFCVRCSVTAVHPQKGVRRKDKQPLAAMLAHRPRRSDALAKPTFGWNARFPQSEMGKIIVAGCGFTVVRER